MFCFVLLTSLALIYRPYLLLYLVANFSARGYPVSAQLCCYSVIEQKLYSHIFSQSILTRAVRRLGNRFNIQMVFKFVPALTFCKAFLGLPQGIDYCSARDSGKLMQVFSASLISAFYVDHHSTFLARPPICSLSLPKPHFRLAKLDTSLFVFFFIIDITCLECFGLIFKSSKPSLAAKLLVVMTSPTLIEPY